MTSTVSTRGRASRLEPADRREAILDAVLPLLRERGREVPSRALAEAAGIAEGTLFRAFGSKEQLFDAAIRRMFDGRPLWADLRSIDDALPLEGRLEEALQRMRRHFDGVAAAAVAMGVRERPAPGPDDDDGLSDALSRTIGDDRDRLAVPIAVVADYLTLVAFASSLPMVPPIVDDVLAGLVARGILEPSSTDA